MNVSLLIFLGAVLGAIVGGSTVFYWLTSWGSLHGLEKWQTLIAGILALLGASATVTAILYQINLDRRRRAKSAKALLAIGASDVMAFCRAAMEYLTELSELRNLPRENVEAFIPPPIPMLEKETLNLLRDAASDLNSEAEEMAAEILACYQIVNSRLTSRSGLFVNGRRRGGPTPSWVLDRQRDLARLAMLSEKLFEPAREGRNLFSNIPVEEADAYLERSIWLRQ